MAISKVTLNTINSNVQTAPAAAVSKNDSKNLQTQIASKQQHLKQLSSDADMTATEKEQKRREIQKEIDELNRKLKQLEMKQKEDAAQAAKKQEKEAALKEELLEKTNPQEKETIESPNVSEEEKVHIDMPVKDIQEMLSADYLIQKERVQEQVDLQKESTIQVLKSEIQQDKLYGSDTTRKEAELAALQEKENFWTDATKQTAEAGNQKNQQLQTAINTNARVVVDQI